MSARRHLRSGQVTRWEPHRPLINFCRYPRGVPSAALKVNAVVFDLLFTLVHPGTYPGGLSPMEWLASLLQVDVDAVKKRWRSFEPLLETGKAASGPAGCGPELTWVRTLAADLGVSVSDTMMAGIEADWDLTRREALLDPPAASLQTLDILRGRGIRLGLLSNTHGLELRTFGVSPLAPYFDAAALSHEIGVCKPDAAAYASVLQVLGLPAQNAAYVGDGSSNELAGARKAGFAMVILADEAARRWSPDDLPRLRAQADASVASLTELLGLFELPL